MSGAEPPLQPATTSDWQIDLHIAAVGAELGCHSQALDGPSDMVGLANMSLQCALCQA